MLAVSRNRAGFRFLRSQTAQRQALCQTRSIFIELARLVCSKIVAGEFGLGPIRISCLAAHFAFLGLPRPRFGGCGGHGSCPSAQRRFCSVGGCSAFAAARHAASSSPGRSQRTPGKRRSRLVFSRFLRPAIEKFTPLSPKGVCVKNGSLVSAPIGFVIYRGVAAAR